MRLLTPLKTALVLLCATSPLTFAWDDTGHKDVVTVAFQFDPALRARVNAVLKNLPASAEWQALEKTGLSNNPKYPLKEKDHPDAWVASLATDAEKAATFPDWLRDYNGYKLPANHGYDKWHFYDSDYDNVNDKRFVETPNGVSKLTQLEKDLKQKKGGDQAWALAWILHIVGDLHQPLHCTSRPIQGGGKSGDEGGNKVMYKGKKLHSYWDELADKVSVASMLKKNAALKGQAKTDFDARAGDLDPMHWVKEGHDLIVGIGYPADQKVADYDTQAHSIAGDQIVLAGARLAKILEKYLP